MNKDKILQIKEMFFRYVPVCGAWMYLVINAIFYTLVTAYLSTQNGDNIEHIHSSFLIATGNIPYRDFFQHHNPLLWYLFAPVTMLFAYDSTVTEVACLVSLLFFLKSLVYVYRIVEEFVADHLWGLIAAAIIAAPGIKLFAVDLRPDNYMIFCLVGGIYYYFCYLRDKRCLQLCGAFVFFVLSFLFAQKALFPLFILGLSGLYFWYKKEIRTEDMLKALIIPVCILCGFFLYLLYYDMVGLYFVSNYKFNLLLAEGFDLSRVFTKPFYMNVYIVCGMLGCLTLFIKKNKYLAVLSALFVAEYLQRQFYFSPYSYYYWLLIYLSSMCAIAFLYKLNNKNRLISILVLLMLYSSFAVSSSLYYSHWIKSHNAPYLPDYITRKISPCDYVFNGDGMMYNLFAKDPSYYWQLIGQLDVIGERAGIRAKPDINALIRQYKPKFIYGRSYFNKFSEEMRKTEIVHYIDIDLVDKYYETTEFPLIYQLKDEYDNRTCEKDVNSGKWQFVFDKR